MEQTRLGDSSVSVSRVGLGTNNFGRKLDRAQTEQVVDAALDAGLTFVDTADGYGGGDSERFIGEILAGRRDRAVIATKFGYRDERGGSAAYVAIAIDESLERLQTDYVDLYYYHRPDGLTPIAETLGALHELVAQGKVRAIGCSNFTAEQLAEAERVADELGTAHFVSLQNRYSLLERGAEDDVLPLCERYGVGFVPYFPLASGLLTGKYRRGEAPPEGSRLADRPDDLTDEAFDRLERLEGWARDHGHRLLELAIAYAASQPAVASVIAGATSAEQVRANAAGGEWNLTPAELAEVAALV
jgi:aryl-alcohol dehydrogenase-like predicted oxidoreductase